MLMVIFNPKTNLTRKSHALKTITMGSDLLIDDFG